MALTAPARRTTLAVFFTALFVMILPTLGAIASVFTVISGRAQWLHVAMFVAGFLLTGLGITIGYHRMLTHRAFETNGVVKAMLLIFGSMAVEGAANAWVANHAKHHMHSDREGDPHSPVHGFIHSHWGWLSEFASIDTGKYAPWVQEDRVAVWVSKTFPLWVTMGYVIPFAIAGWEGLVWGGLFRQLAVQNVTFAVNSVCHRWGARPFNTTDLSRNNWIVGVLGMGEGWHNNHHAFPVSAFHGLRWWEFDLSGEIIRLMEALKLIRNVRRPNLQQIERKLFNPGEAGLYARVTG